MPDRFSSAHPSASITTSKDSNNFYQPLQEDIDHNEAEVAAFSSKKSGCSSHNSSSSESSGILHAITQGDLNTTQSSTDNQNDGMQQTQDFLEEQTTYENTSTQQSNATTVTNQTQSNAGDQSGGTPGIPPNPYCQPDSGRGGGIIRNTVSWADNPLPRGTPGAMLQKPP